MATTVTLMLCVLILRVASLALAHMDFQEMVHGDIALVCVYFVLVTTIGLFPPNNTIVDSRIMTRTHAN